MLASPALILALVWMLLLGWGCHCLLRRHLRLDDQLAERDAQLLIERHARANAERALASTHLSLCQLARQQETVREKERQRIGRDLHADLGQSLLALKVELSLLQVSTKGTHPVITGKVEAMLAGLDQALAGLRDIIGDLRPAALAQGLKAAIEWQLAEFTRLYGMRHLLQADQAAFDMPRDTERDAMLFRILQESLANIGRHAHATEVEVALQRCGAVLTLSVRDNGVGMPPEPPTQGSGLPAIRERATAIGGRVSIASEPGQGTEVRITFPIAQVVAIH